MHAEKHIILQTIFKHFEWLAHKIIFSSRNMHTRIITFDLQSYDIFHFNHAKTAGMSKSNTFGFVICI